MTEEEGICIVAVACGEEVEDETMAEAGVRYVRHIELHGLRPDDVGEINVESVSYANAEGMAALRVHLRRAGATMEQISRLIEDGRASGLPMFVAAYAVMPPTKPPFVH